jgi:hypothetical protein
MSFLIGGITRMMRKRKRQQRLEAAAQWPKTQAKLLSGVLVDGDELAEGTLAQDRQLEFPYYFTLTEGPETGYFSGYLRSAPGSEGEMRRLQKVVEEGTPVTVRYNPSNPDQGCVLARDNTDLSFGVWEA